LYLLNSLLTKSSIAYNQIRILTIKKLNFPHIYKIEFSVSCENNNILNFLNAIDEINRFIIIQSFKYQLSHLNKNFKQEIIFYLICYIPSFYANKLILDLSRINKKVTKSLEKVIMYPLNKLKILGFLSNNEKQSFSLVGLPNNKIYKIILGNYLGIEQGLVIGTYPEKIVIKNNKTNEIISLSNKLRKLAYDKNFS